MKAIIATLAPKSSVRRWSMVLVLLSSGTAVAAETLVPSAPTIVPAASEPPADFDAAQPISVAMPNKADGFTWHLSLIGGGRSRGNPGFAPASEPSKLHESAFAAGEGINAAVWLLSPGNGLNREPSTRSFGSAKGIPVTGDFDGDGRTDLGAFEDGQWYLDLNGNGVRDPGDLWVQLGAAGEVPVTGDFDGDGKSDLGVFGPAWPKDRSALTAETGLPDADNIASLEDGARKNAAPANVSGWRTLKLSAAGEPRVDPVQHVFQFGSEGDVPVIGDWNHDGIDNVGIFRDGRWILDLNGDGRWNEEEEPFDLGTVGDLPVVGDFNGDGILDFGVYRQGKWLLDLNNDRSLDDEDPTLELGTAGDLPVVGDWDGDGADEIGIVRPAK